MKKGTKRLKRKKGRKEFCLAEKKRRLVQKETKEKKKRKEKKKKKKRKDAMQVTVKDKTSPKFIIYCRAS